MYLTTTRQQISEPVLSVFLRKKFEIVFANLKLRPSAMIRIVSAHFEVIDKKRKTEVSLVGHLAKNQILTFITTTINCSTLYLCL